MRAMSYCPCRIVQLAHPFLEFYPQEMRGVYVCVSHKIVLRAVKEEYKMQGDALI